MTKLAYLVSHPIQYQAPLLRMIANDPDIDLTVLFLSDLSLKTYEDKGFGATVTWDVPLIDGYSHEFLPAIGDTSRLSFTRPFNYGVVERLKAGRFDVLWTHGYAHYAQLQAIEAARDLGMRVLMRGESNLLWESTSPVKMAVKRRFLGWLFDRCDGMLCIGSLNRDYYRHYGVPAHKLFSVPYAVDNAFFQSKAQAARPQREAFRQALGLAPGRPVILYASKLMGRKHPMDLLIAHRRLLGHDEALVPYLLFVGSGEEEARLKAYAAELGGDSVRFFGFRNQTELPAFFDLCDVFVLPSTSEPWGLIVNEVMNAGKPVIVTDQVGCGVDLVHDGENGFVVPARDVEALARALREVLTGAETAERMGARSLARIDQWSFREDLAGLKQALYAGEGV